MNVSCPLFDIGGNFNISSWVDNFTLTSGSLLKYDLTQFRRLPLSALLSDGLLAGMPIVDFHLLRPTESFDSLGMKLSSILESSVFNSTQVTFTTESDERISTMAQSILSWTLTSVEEVANGVVKGVLAGTIRNGSGGSFIPSEADSDSNRTIEAVAIAAAAFVVMNGLFLCISLCKSRTSTDNQMTEPLLSHNDHLEMGRCETIVEIDRLENTEGMLFLEKAVPMHIRHTFPVIIIGTIFLLLTSNLSVGASVDVIVSSDSGRTMSLDSLFAFSLGNTVREMYNAGIYPLLFLVLGFSGIWPYAKLLLMLYGWCAPTRILNLRQRGRMLFLLDSLGKFSLVDTFVLVLMMVSFRFHLVLDGLMTLDVFVNPGFGFYGFLLATSVSLIGGHVILFFHRRSLTNVQSFNQTKESLCQHEFKDKEYDSRRKMTKFFSGLIVSMVALALVFLSIGMTTKSFIFEVGGLAGRLLGDDRRNAYSLLTLGSSLPQSVENPSFGMTCLQTAYFFYSVIMPFSCLVALIVLFLLPMTLAWQKRIMALAEICNAWGAVEVFALSIIASLVELSTFASFIIGNKCNLINEFLANHFDDVMNGDDTCYTVTSSVAGNVWYLVCGALLNSFIVSFLLKVAHRAFQERVERQDDEFMKDHCSAHDDIASHDLVSMLLHSKCSGILFYEPEDEERIREEQGVDNVSTYYEECANTRRRRSQSDVDTSKRRYQGSKEFWDEWREICSVT